MTHICMISIWHLFTLTLFNIFCFLGMYIRGEKIPPHTPAVTLSISAQGDCHGRCSYSFVGVSGIFLLKDAVLVFWFCFVSLSAWAALFDYFFEIHRGFPPIKIDISVLCPPYAPKQAAVRDCRGKQLWLECVLYLWRFLGPALLFFLFPRLNDLWVIYLVFGEFDIVDLSSINWITLLRRFEILLYSIADILSFPCHRK